VGSAAAPRAEGTRTAIRTGLGILRAAGAWTGRAALTGQVRSEFAVILALIAVIVVVSLFVFGGQVSRVHSMVGTLV
jgi:Flp pilus assembly pilin Flp